MGRGTHRGFITYEELSKSLGKRNLSDENLSQAFIHILDENITLVEKKSDFKVLRKKESSNKEEGKTIEKSDDPIRMYLREMGGVELLSREGEIAIAKRIEAGKDVMLIALSQSPITAQQFFEWNDKLQNDEILVREIIDIDTNYMEDESTGPSAKIEEVATCAAWWPRRPPSTASVFKPLVNINGASRRAGQSVDRSLSRS